MSRPPTLDLDTLTLAAGAHERRTDGVCLLEAAAWLAGESHSDHPSCVSPVIAAFGRSWNDALAEPPRTQLLKPLLPLLIGTATTPEDEEIRAWLATDWLARVHTPAWLRLAGLTEHAIALEGCARIVDAVTARAAQPTLDVARQASAAARAAARDAAWDAAWAAARAAARDAARAAARDAASAAARDAASAAASAAAWDAARAAARAAARDAARDAAWDAARAAARDAAWDAAWAAARATIQPTVEALQASAVELLKAMCAVGRQEVQHDARH